MSTTNIELRRIHGDILKLIRTLCYEGLPETRCALVDPNDRRLPLWEPNPHNTRFVLDSGVPEPFVRACFNVVPFDESEQRWGKNGHHLDPALQYLIDRGLLDTSDDNWPICAAFKNYFNDSEILSTVRIVVNENGRFYVWDVLCSQSSIVHEQNGSLVTGSPYRVFKLTERAHELLDAEKTATEPAQPAVGARVGETKTDPEPVEHLKPSHARAKALYDWALEHIDGSEDMTYADLFEKLMNDPHCDGEGLPGNAATFARYCHAAGVRRNTPRHEKGATRSVRRVSDL